MPLTQHQQFHVDAERVSNQRVRRGTERRRVSDLLDDIEITWPDGRLEESDIHDWVKPVGDEDKDSIDEELTRR